MVTGEKLAVQAATGGYIGIPYEKLDCQGFVERVIADCGIRKPNGVPYNWRGSNSMYRNYYQWHGSIDLCKKSFGLIPQGALVFKMRNDDGEVEHGYTDGLGNFYHVGIYLGESGRMVIHSTTGGVQYAKSLSGWTHVSLLSMIDYTKSNVDNPGLTARLNNIFDEIEKLIKEGRDLIK